MLSGFTRGSPRYFVIRFPPHGEPHAHHGCVGEPPHHILDHCGVVCSVSVHEDPGAGDWDGGQGADVVEHAHPVPAQLGVVDHPPDVDGLAVVPDAEDEVPLVLVFLDGVVLGWLKISQRWKMKYLWSP